MQASLVELAKRASRNRGGWMLWAIFLVVLLEHVQSLSGPNVCLIKQKYNITKRIKYRAPMSVRTYEWCFALPPRCSRWTTEMRDLTRLETEERTAEVAVCCPGYKMKDITCIPICPNGRTGPACSEECPKNKWGPNCVNECKQCTNNGTCSPNTGECQCQDGWKGESCQIRMATTTVKTPTDALMTSETFATLTRILTSPVVVTSQSKETLTTTTIGPTTNSLTTPFIKSTEYFVPKVDAKLILNYTTSRINIFSPTTENHTKVTKTTSVAFTSPNVKEPSATSTLSPKVKSHTTASAPMSTAESKRVLAKINLAIDTADVRTDTDVVGSTKEKETSKVIETTTKTTQFVSKTKPKEIWIKPAQKGDFPVIETKHKITNETMQTKNKYVTKNLLTSIDMTPKTIIVSIIPTSLAYPTFKKISLTTAAYQQAKEDSSTSRKLKNDHYTTSMNWSNKINLQPTAPTAEPKFTLKVLSTDIIKPEKASTIINGSRLKFVQNVTKSDYSDIPKRNKDVTTNMSTTPLYIKGHSATNRMKNKNYKTVLYSMLTTKSLHFSPTNHLNSRNSESISTLTTNIPITNKMLDSKTLKVDMDFETNTRSFTKYHTTQIINVRSTVKNEDENFDKSTKRSTPLKALASTIPEYVNRTNKNGFLTKLTTTVFPKHTNLVTSTEKTVASEDETFDILTEPEHITAVMGDKERDKTSLDLLSVLSIAGGSMMAIITVAVVIVMIERCKKSRYDDMHKVNNIRMQVVMENTDVPPPYVRSIFHTPLPEPPRTEKCHYQPISTLDRNLKQFMRPVVVQAISPVMFENFRGILECHYDHLPRRSNDFEVQRHLIAPSYGNVVEPHQGRSSRIDYTVSESTIEVLKCEAKLNVIDSSTSEPLYAEIPSWRPPSEHAIEVVNVTGEAVTEL